VDVQSGLVSGLRGIDWREIIDRKLSGMPIAMAMRATCSSDGSCLVLLLGRPRA